MLHLTFTSRGCNIWFIFTLWSHRSVAWLFTVCLWNWFIVAHSLNKMSKTAELTLSCSNMQCCPRIIVFQIHVHGWQSKPEGRDSSTLKTGIHSWSACRFQCEGLFSAQQTNFMFRVSASGLEQTFKAIYYIRRQYPGLVVTYLLRADTSPL